MKPKPKEHEIEQRLRYLSGVLQAAPDAIVSTDAHMNVVMWNPGAERLFGYSSEEAAGRNIDDLITNADIRAEALQYSEITMSQEHLFHAETARCRKDGALVDVLLSAAPILVQGNHIGSVAIYTDITERKQTEQALHAAKAAAQQQRRRAESLQEVAAVLSSSLERDTVLSKIMEQLGRVVAYDGAGILLLEGDSLVVSGGSESVQPFLGKRFAITGQGPAARLYQERRTIIIDDVHHDPHWETWPGIENIRSWMGAPLIIGQQVIGVLTLDSYTIAAYTEKDAELFQTFAHQAALAIKNARLFETERAALEQAETLYAASLALSATMDLQQVLERILAQLRDVAPYDSASVQQWVGDHMEVIAGAGYKKFAHMIGVRYDAHDELNQELIAKRAPMIIEDAREYPILKTADQSRHGIRGWLAAPLLFGERLIGKITLDHHEPGFYTQEHANRAMAFATQAAIAIENARLYSQAQAELAERKQAEEGLRQQRNYLSALHDTALALLNRLEIGDLLDNILAHAKRLLNVEIGEIALVTTRGESVQLVSGVGNAQQPLDTSRGLDGLVWRTGEVQIVPDYAAWELRRPEPQYDVIHGAVGLPLKIGAAVVGIMTLGATELARQFTAEEVELLEQFARLAALAIDNARLFDETQQAKQAADTLRAAYLDLSQSLELDLICEKLLDWLKKFTPYDSATIFLLEGDTRLVARAVRGYEAWGVLDQARTAAFEIESASGVAAVITGQKSRLIPDVTQDPRWIGVASAAHVRAWLGVPMMSGGKVIGVCSLDSAQTNFFEPEHVQLAESLAIQAAFAIQNAASYDEARQARKVAEAANRAKSIFLAKMSHELRTPLNGILGYAQILKRNPDLRPAQRDGLNLIHQSGTHLLTLINDVLDLAKVEAGKIELFPSAINLARFLENVTGIIRMRAQQKGIRFIYDPDDDLPAGIFADETRLRQVLINLLGNAVKFTEQGSVTLRVEILDNSISDIGYSMLDNQSSIPNAQSASGGAGSTKYPITNIQFTVEDTGPGIPADQMNTIFQPFEQIGATEYRAEGTGLGLSISRQLVQAMGSELQVESQVGQGSRFWFEAQFPIVAASEQEEAAAPEISGYHGARKRILVVDDKSENRLVLLGMLTPLGFEVDLATDGEAALVSVREFQPDLILMDLVMPGMSGFEAVEQIRQMPAAAARQTPIVAVSASVLDMDQARSQQIGCDAFLPKPIVTGELLALIGDLLSLEWVLESSAAALSVDEAEMTVVATALLPPPGEQLEVLHELALYGSMERIQQQADQIEALDPKYGPFARQLRKLAAEFEDEKILALVEQFREENDQPG